jgi:hypothetical protein
MYKSLSVLLLSREEAGRHWATRHLHKKVQADAFAGLDKALEF